MRIQNMFQDDINRKINGVIKVNQDDLDVIMQEVREYVITRELKKHFMTFFNYYCEMFDNPNADIGVWLSGFFGSGTDGRNIVVDPAHDEMFCDKAALEKTGAFLNWPSVVLSDMWNALRIITRAQTIHECLHVLYTDFPPKAASEPLCDTKLKKKILAHIDNIIEDAYIEAVGCSVYDNMEFYLRFGRVSRLFASHPSEGTASRSMKEENEKAAVDPEVKHKLDLVMEFLNVVCTDLLYPMLDPEEPSEELKPYIEQAKPIYMQGSMAPSPDERYAHSWQVFEIILPLIPDIEADLDDEKLKERLGGEKTHDAFSSSIGTEPHKGRTQQVTIRLFTDAEGNKRDDLPSLDQIMTSLAQFAKDKQVALSTGFDCKTVIDRGERT